MHNVKETDMLAAKLDLLLKRMDDREKSTESRHVQSLNSHYTREVCGDGGHSGNNCLEIREEQAFINNYNNGYHPQGGQGWNQSRPPY